MADSQVPWGLEALNGAVSQPAWRTKPSWYSSSTDDKMIPPDAQRAMSKRAGSTVVEVKGSHAVYVSQPQAVAAIIAKAATGVAVATARRIDLIDRLPHRRVATAGVSSPHDSRWQELEAIPILKVSQLTRRRAAGLPRARSKWTTIVVTNPQLHHARLEPLVGGACHDATARGFELPKRLKRLRFPRGLTGQVAMLTLALIWKVILASQSPRNLIWIMAGLGEALIQRFPYSVKT